MARKVEFILVKREPTYKEIRRKRLAHGLTQIEAAELVYVKIRMWEYYEASEYRMDRARWELFCYKLALFYPIVKKR